MGLTYLLSDNLDLNVYKHTELLLTTKLLFWGTNWSWAGHTIKRTDFVDGKATFSGGTTSLNALYTGEILLRDSGFDVVLNVEITKPSTNISGGALEVYSVPAIAETVPKLVDGKFVLPDVSIKVPDCPNYFEKNDVNKLRCTVIGTNPVVGKTTYKYSVDFAVPATREVSQAERYRSLKPEGWFKSLMQVDKFPVDFSRFNHPAGDKGYVVSRNGHLFYENTGDRAKFAGANLAAGFLFSDINYIEEQAKRMAAAGFNFARLHHADSNGWVAQTIFGDRSKITSTGQLDKTNMDKLCLLKKVLKKNGIYLWFDLHVGRKLLAGDLDFPTAQEMKKDQDAGKNIEVKVYNYFDEKLQEKMLATAKAILTYPDPYTGKSFCDDPGMVGVTITNENDVTRHFMSIAADPTRPILNKMFLDKTQEFATKNSFPVAQVREYWKPGPGNLFANYIENEFNQKFISLIKSTCPKLNIVTTNLWGPNSYSSLPSLMAGNGIDYHYYETEGFLKNDPNRNANIATWIASHRLSDKFTFVSEWNAFSGSIPNIDRGLMPNYLYSIASLQDWDILCVFAYCQSGLTVHEKQGMSIWDIFMDPAAIIPMAAANAMFRQGFVSQGRQLATVSLSNALTEAFTPHDRADLTRLSEYCRLFVHVPNHPVLTWMNSTSVPANTVAIPTVNTTVKSDTSEVYRNYIDGTHVINTSKYVCIQGQISKQFDTDKVKLFPEPGDNCFTFSIMSNDDLPIHLSNDLIIFVSGRCMRENNINVYNEPVKLKAALVVQSGMKLSAVGFDGLEVPLPTTVDSGYTIFSTYGNSYAVYRLRK